jgi:hypothetical protein
MHKLLVVLAALAGSVILVPPISAAGQTVPGAQGGASPLYRPGLGDLMTMTVQPRHIKLALAGRERNWAYAAYELHELEESFERAARAWPQWRSLPIADMMTSVTKEPVAALAQAIKATDADKFAVAYKQLTDGCNSCHKSADRGVIAILVPETSPFSDQDFRPTQP